MKILHENVPSDWKIHMHCFGESSDMAAQLLATYSNVYFGFTGTYLCFCFLSVQCANSCLAEGAITFSSAGSVLNVVKMVPMNRLLLETDCPLYVIADPEDIITLMSLSCSAHSMAPEPHRGKVAQPAMIPLVARKVTYD